MSATKLNVKFKGVSIGKTTARIGFEVDRKDQGFGVNDAENLFLDSRLEVSMVMDAEQQHIKGMEPEPLVSVADVKGYGAKADTISAGLTFTLTEIKVESLSHFANRPGEISLKRVGAASNAADEHDGQIDDDDTPELPLDDGSEPDVEPDVDQEDAVDDGTVDIDDSDIQSWRDYPITALEMTAKAAEQIGDEHSTVGSLADAMVSEPIAYLRSFKGIGQGKAKAIIASIEKLQAEHPDGEAETPSEPEDQPEPEPADQGEEPKPLGDVSASDLAKQEDDVSPPASTSPAPAANDDWRATSLRGLIADPVVDVWALSGAPQRVGAFYDWLKRNDIGGCVSYFVGKGVPQPMAAAAVKKIDDFCLPHVQ